MPKLPEEQPTPFDRYIRKSSHCDPDWRWQRAAGAASRCSENRSRDLTIWRLIDALSDGTVWVTDPQNRFRFSIRSLLGIFHDRFRRLTLESRLLAYRDPALVAKACGITTETVESYCLIFFDVLDRLHIHQNSSRPSTCSGLLSLPRYRTIFSVYLGRQTRVTSWPPKDLMKPAPHR